ncbi:MAG: ribose 5-phosphate isomerase B [Candidatus Omnitrophota bacterium]
MRNKFMIVIGSDHAGFKLKQYLKAELNKLGYKIKDIGTFSEESVDYPDYAEKVACLVSKSRQKKGILVCATGIGMSIAANKIPGIRAALAYDVSVAALSRQHNDSNILVLSGRPCNKARARKILLVWLKTEFEGQRHARRVQKIARIEKKHPGV